MPFNPEVSAALAAAGVTATVATSVASVPEGRTLPAGSALLEQPVPPRSRTYVVTPPRVEGVAHFVVTKDPSTGRVRWAIPDARTGAYILDVPQESAPLPPAPGAPRADAALFVAPPPPPAPSATVLAVPLTALQAFESTFLPHALWAWTADTYTTPKFWSSNGHRGNQLGDQFWNGQPRALGVLHGFIDRGPSCFGSSYPYRGPLDVDTVQQLVDAYDGQAFAFDRPTIMSSPDDNVAWLVGELGARQPRYPLVLDLLCHSQGGLVARALARALASRPDLEITIGNIVFVATPNAGTPLTDITADAGAVGCAMLQAYAQMFGSFGLASASVEIPMVLQILAVPIEKLAEAPGVQAMAPGSPFLTALAQAPAPPSFGIAAQYDPKAIPGGAVTAALGPVEGIVSPVFGGAANDIIVPTASVGGANGAFQVLAADGVYHLSYFQDTSVQAQILEWLTPST